MNILNGQAFSLSGEEYKSQVLISEQLAARLPYDHPIGETISVLDDDYGRVLRTIVGVYESPNFYAKTVAPFTLMLPSERLYDLDLKIAPDNQAATLDGIRKSYHEIVPNRPFSYRRMSDQVLGWYTAEQNFSTIFKYFAAIAMMIAAIGLIGLSAFTVVQKNKEIGVRKVLGATVSRITLRLLSRYVSLILLAMLVATPLSYMLMKAWLTDFAEPVGVSTVVFISGFGLAILLLFLTVGFQTIRAAQLNPVEILKDE